MIKKVIKKITRDNNYQADEDLAYWLTKSHQERIETVEILRRQHDGSTARLQRIIRIIQRTKS